MNIFTRKANQVKDFFRSTAKRVEKAPTRDNGSIVSFINFNTFNFPYKNLHSYYRAYQTIPQLRAIIGSSAKAFSRGIPKVKEIKNGESTTIIDDQVLKLLNKPHPLYSKGVFWETFYSSFQLYDRVHVFINKPVGMKPESMFLLPTKDTFMVPYKDIDLNDIVHATKLSDFVKEYAVEFEGDIYYFDVDQIWTFMNGSLNLDKNIIRDKIGQGSYLYPDEKMRSLKQPLKIIAAAYDSDVEMKVNYGALGILNPKAKDSGGMAMPMTDPDVEQVQRDYLEYGTSKDKYKLMISKMALDFTPISLPYDKLKLSESIDEQKKALCDVFGYPLLLLNQLEGSTFANLEVSDKTLYTNKIIPEANLIANGLSEVLQLGKENKVLEFDYSSIEALQKDKEKEANKNKINLGTITSLNKAVQSGEIGRNEAIFALSQEWGISEEKAAKYISEKNEESQQEINQEVEQEES